MIGKDELEALRGRVSLFEGFTDAEVAALLDRCGQQLRFEAGQVIFREGGPGKTAYLILTGRVRISAPGQAADETLADLEQGDIFGEMALVDAAPRSARATALAPTRLLGLREAAITGFDPLLAAKLFRNFATILAARLRGANEAVARLGAENRALTAQVGAPPPAAEPAAPELPTEAEEADLRHRKLRGATMRGIRLHEVNLRGADLRGADLRGAWFIGANLTKADLCGADLRRATFRACNVDRAQLAGARLDDMVVTDEMGEPPEGYDDAEG